jgi:hypothetical protein
MSKSAMRRLRGCPVSFSIHAHWPFGLISKNVNPPSWGFRRDAGFRGCGSPTGTMVTAIVRSPDGMINNWSAPPYDGFHNPTYVGKESVRSTVRFADPSEGGAQQG